MSGLRRMCPAWLAFVLVLILAGSARAAPISPGQEATEQLFYLVLVPAVAIGVLVMALVAYAVIKFRVRPGHTEGPANPATGNRRLEAAWTILPAIILVVVGIAGFQALIVTDTIPRDPEVIVQVNAHQWYWSFNITYIRTGLWLNSTGNFKYLETTGALTLKAGLTVKILLHSFDVNHAFWLIPFDLKIDVIAGHTNPYWLRPDQTGDYPIKCAEYCGLNHYSMTATLHVVA
jgi:cytochrome c oxidase subunit 2